MPCCCVANASSWRWGSCKAIPGVFAAIALAIGLPAEVHADERYFNIPSESADLALTELARQAGVVLLYPYDVVSQVKTNSVVGEHELAEAAAIMLEGTGLTVAVVDGGEQLVVNRVAKEVPRAEPTKGRKGILGSIVSAFSGVDGRLDSTPLQGRRGIEEIVVTAQKVSTDLQSTPISIAAVSGERLEQLGIQHSQEIDTFIPNLQYDTATASGGTGATISIRGVGTFRSTKTGQSTVAVYVDDVLLAGFEGNMLNLLDLERVEVLRGPQGMLFGRNAIGGAIHYISKRPDTEVLYGRIKAMGGENGRASIDAALNLPFSEHFAARFAMSDTSADGYITSRFDGRRLGAQESTGFRAALIFETSDALSFDLILDRIESEQDGEVTVYQMDQNYLDVAMVGDAWIGGGTGGAAGGGGTGGFRPWTNAGAGRFDMRTDSPTFATITGLTSGQCAPIGFTAPCSFSFDMYDLDAEEYSTLGTDVADVSKLTLSGAVFKANWEATPGLTLRSITGYRDSKLDRPYDNDGTPFAVRSGWNLLQTESLSEEFQFIRTGKRTSLVGGVYYYDEEHITDERQSQFGNLWYDDSCVLNFAADVYSYLGCTADEYAGDGAPAPTYGRVDTTSQAVYMNWSMPLSEVFELILGGRYTNDEQSLFLQSRTGFTTEGLRGTVFSENVFTPRVVLSAQWTDSVFTYLSYSQGYRQGGINATLAVGDNGAFLDELVPPFLSETNDAYEIGAKVDFWRGRARLNAAYYTYDYRNLQTTAEGPEGQVAPYEQNAADVDIHGVEMDFTALLGDRWSLNASIGTADAKYKRIGSQATQISRESPLPRAPELSYVVGVEYQRQTSNGRWFASVNYGFTGEQYSTPQDFNYLATSPTGEGLYDYLCTEVVPSLNRTDACNGNQGLMPDYGLVNGRIQFSNSADTWTAGIYCRNCLNEYYLIGLSQFGQTEPLATPFLFNQLNPGRPREVGIDFDYRFGSR